MLCCSPLNSGASDVLLDLGTAGAFAVAGHGNTTSHRLGESSLGLNHFILVGVVSLGIRVVEVVGGSSILLLHLGRHLTAFITGQLVGVDHRQHL